MTTRLIRDDETSVFAAIEAVAAHLNQDPKDLHPPLSAAVDPDALETLTKMPGTEVKFSYDGHEIRVFNRTKVKVESV